jgi:hypothetical protein
LYPLYVLNGAHPSDGYNLLWVGFDVVIRDDEPEYHTSRDPENAFSRVEFYAVISKLLEDFFEVDNELINLF